MGLIAPSKYLFFFFYRQGINLLNKVYLLINNFIYYLIKFIYYLIKFIYYLIKFIKKKKYMKIKYKIHKNFLHYY